LKDKEIKRIKSQWRSKFGGVDKAHLFAILTGGLKLDTGFKQSMKDMEFLEMRKFSRDEIFSIFRVPKTLVSITEDVNRANAQEHKAVFIENTIKPKMARLVAFLNEFYMPDFQREGETLYLGYKDPSPENVEMNLDIVNSGLGGKTGVGWLTINEARAIMDYDDIGKEGDRIFAGFQMSPITEAEGKTKAYIRTPRFKEEKERGVIVRHRVTPADVIKSKIKTSIKESKEFRKIIYHVLSRNAEKPVKKKENRKDEFNFIPRDKAEAFWKQMIARSDVQEVKFKKTLVEFFKDQEKKVLANLRGIKRVKAIKAIDKYVFDIAEESDILVEVVDPLINLIIAQAGQAALDFVGSTETFSFKDEVINLVSKFENLLAVSVNTTTKKKLIKQLQEGIANDESVDALAKRVESVYNQATRKRATMIARTETIRANNLGHIAGYKQSGLVEFKEWLTTPDDRTCEFCLAMEKEYRVKELDAPFLSQGTELEGIEGGIYKLDYSDLLAPPLHANCRCTIIPVVKVGRSIGDNYVKYAERKEKIRELKVKERKVKVNLRKLENKLEDKKKEIEGLVEKKAKEVEKEAKKILDEKIKEAEGEKEKIVKEAEEIRDRLRQRLYE